MKLPLPIYSTVSLSTIIGRDGTAFTLYAGVSQEHTEQLKAFSLDKTDEAIQNNTSDRKRFGEGSYEDWYNKGRTPFSLIEPKTNALAAIIWFGPKAIGTKSMKHISEAVDQESQDIDAGNGHTIAYRAYIPYRGVGIMKKAVLMATDAYVQVFPEAQLWAIVDERNEASVGLSKALGYVISGDSDGGFVVMVRG